MASTSIASDEELRFLVMCHDALSKLSLERVSLLSKEYCDRCDGQATVVAGLGASLMGETVEESHSRAIEKILDGMVACVQVMSAAEGQYEGIGASQKVGGDAVYKKEVDTRESIMGRVDGTFSELSLNNSRIVENLFLRVVSTCSGITRDLQARGERTRELGKGADLKLAEMEKVAASRREKLLEEARLKKEEGVRREREENKELAR